MSFYLAIVSPLDHPLFELSFPSSRPGGSSSSNPAGSSSSASSSALPSWSSFTGSLSASASSNTLTSLTGSSAAASAAAGSSSHSHAPGSGQQALGATQGVYGAPAHSSSQQQQQPSDLGFAPTPDTPVGGAHARSGSLGGLDPSGAGGGIGERWLAQMVVHKSLDSVEEAQEGSGALYLKGIDRHNEWTVSAFLAGSVKFVLLHDVKNDDGIRLFFLDLWELYIKVLVNPFHTINTPIRNPIFDAKVRASAKRNL